MISFMGTLFVIYYYSRSVEQIFLYFFLYRSQPTEAPNKGYFRN